MSKVFPEITPESREWIARQPMFFVATAPMAADGLLNCSPKGLGGLTVLDALTVGYVDFTGSGVETIAHVRENGRIVIMLCAFSGAPRILRLYGRGEVVTPASPRWADLSGRFTLGPGARAIVLAHLTRIADSCGWGVPVFEEHTSDRDTLRRWAESKGEDGVKAYRAEKNRVSLDGLPGVEA